MADKLFEFDEEDQEVIINDSPYSFMVDKNVFVLLAEAMVKKIKESENV